MTDQAFDAEMQEIDALAESAGLLDVPASPRPARAPSRAALIAALEESHDIVNGLISTGTTNATGAPAGDVAATVARNAEQIAVLTGKIEALLTLHGLNPGGGNDG